uniref:Uncharacterized protein n=1 Tax=Ascaris lumbricoides TaxID=6252 RepID=A0A0M3HKH9_ASCLU
MKNSRLTSSGARQALRTIYKRKKSRHHRPCESRCVCWRVDVLPTWLASNSLFSGKFVEQRTCPHWFIKDHFSLERSAPHQRTTRQIPSSTVSIRHDEDGSVRTWPKSREPIATEDLQSKRKAVTRPSVLPVFPSA